MNASTGSPVWIVFKAGAAVTPNGTDSYLIRLTTTSATQIFVYTASGNNWSRQVIYSGSGAGLSAAPGANDKIIICGNWTAATASNDITVTYDNTAATVWGPSAAGFAISVGNHGILEQQVTGGLAYVLNYLGRFSISGGGIWRNNGGTALPSTSSLTVTAQNVANVDCGLEIGALGTVTLTGATKTTLQTKLTSNIGGLCSTTNVANSVVTRLEGESFTGMTGTFRLNGSNVTILSVTDSDHLTITTNVGALTAVEYSYATNDNVLNVVACTDWANSDLLCLAPSSRTAASAERVTISSIASLAVTLTAAALNYHSSLTTPNDVRAEIGNLTRNIKIQGLSSTLGSYVNINATATVTLRYTEFTLIGSATALKRGIDVGTTTGSFDMQFCSIHDCTVASSIGVNCNSASNNNVIFSNSVTYNIANVHFNTTAGNASVSWTCSNNLSIKNSDSAVVIHSILMPQNVFSGVMTYTNNSISGGVQNALLVNTGGNGGFVNSLVFSGNSFHSSTSAGISFASVFGVWTLDTIVAWRNQRGITNITTKAGYASITNLTAFGNSIANVTMTSSAGILRFSGCDLRAGANLTCPIGIDGFGNAVVSSGILLETCVFGGGGQTHSTGDINSTTASSCQIVAMNSTFNSANIISSQSGLQPYAFIASMKHGGVAGSHRFFTGEGTMTTDSTIFQNASPALRMTPIATVNPTLRNCESAPPGFGFCVPVANGNTLSVSVGIRRSVVGDGTAYNGNAPRLIVRRNVAAGIAADTVLYTSIGAAGSWELLTGTTIAVTDDAILEFIVDSGTGVASPTGWINVDDWAVSAGAAFGSLGGQKFWFNGFPASGFPAGGLIGAGILSGGGMR